MPWMIKCAVRIPRSAISQTMFRETWFKTDFGGFSNLGVAVAKLGAPILPPEKGPRILRNFHLN